MSKQNKGARRKGSRNRHAKTLRRRARVSERTRRGTGTEAHATTRSTDLPQTSEQIDPPPEEDISNEELERRIEEQEKEIERFSRTETQRISSEMDASLTDARETVHRAHEALFRKRFNDLCEVNASQVLTRSQIRNLHRDIGNDLRHSTAVMASLDREWNGMPRMDVFSAIHPMPLREKEIKPFYIFSLFRRVKKAFSKRVPDVHIPAMSRIVESLYIIMVVDALGNTEDFEKDAASWNLFIELSARLSLSILESDLQRYAPIVWYTLLRSIVQMERQGKFAEARAALIEYLEKARKVSGDIGYHPAFITTPAGEAQYRNRLVRYLQHA